VQCQDTIVENQTPSSTPLDSSAEQTEPETENLIETITESSATHSEPVIHVASGGEVTEEDSAIIAVPYFISDSLMQVMDTVKHTVEWKKTTPSGFIPESPGKIIIKDSGRKPQWIFVWFILQLLILIYLKTSYLKRMEEYFKAYFNINLSQQLFRDQESVLSFQVIVVMLNFLLSCSLLIYLLADYFFNPAFSNPSSVILQIFLAVTIIYSAKYAGYLFLENVFPFQDEISLFSFNYFMNQKLLGVLLIPFIYAAAYSELSISKYFLFISAALFLLSLVIRAAKGILIGAKYLRKTAFHFLIYICTFEIAPLLILIKWLQTMANGQN